MNELEVLLFFLFLFFVLPECEVDEEKNIFPIQNKWFYNRFGMGLFKAWVVLALSGVAPR